MGLWRRLNRKMEYYYSSQIAMETPTKDKKLYKARRRSNRNIYEALLGTLPSSQRRQISEEEEHRNKLEMSNLQLFFWRSQALTDSYPSAFELIKLAPHSEPSEITLQQLLLPTFPVLAYKIKELVGFACLLLQANSVAQGFNGLRELFSTIAQNYNSISYHNFSHAFNLLLINSQCMQREPTLKSLFSAEEEFCIAVAALSHDLNHRGTNNQFQVQRKSELARLSDNHAVLEHMHVRTLWRILQDHPHLDFLPQISNQPAARHIITRLILSTDMAEHSAGLATLKSVRTLPLADHKWTIMEQLFHACDIGNPCLDYDVYMSWAALLAFQFDAQARLEEKLGLQVSRGFVYRGLGGLYSDQEWFLGSLVQPLWKEISQMLPNLSVFRSNVQRNLQRIKQEKTKQESRHSKE